MVKTLLPDTEAPTVTSRKLTVTRVNTRSFTISWEAARDNVTASSNIRYQVYLRPNMSSADPWRMVKEAKGITSHSFTGLKADTQYAIYVKALDENGNALQYPLANACLRVKTKDKDTQAPTIDNRTIRVLEAPGNQIIIRWNPATEDETAAKDILYKIGLTKTNDPSDSWRIVKEGKNITTHTFTGLKNHTSYSFFVKAIDEAGNVLQYPLDDGCLSATTDSANAKLVFQNGGTVFCDGLYGSISKSYLREDMGTKFKMISSILSTWASSMSPINGSTSRSYMTTERSRPSATSPARSAI